MSVSQIKLEVARLPVTQQEELASYLLQLKRLRKPSPRRVIARSSVNRKQDWITVGQLKKHWEK